MSIATNLEVTYTRRQYLVRSADRQCLEGVLNDMADQGFEVTHIIPHRDDWAYTLIGRSRA